MADEPQFICPGCGSVSTVVRGERETVHDDECDWYHDRERTAPDA